MLALLTRPLQETWGILKGFRGNTRTCLLVEPMWGIPFNLYSTYTSLYMLALGCTELQVGLIATVGLGIQVIFAFISGHVTDRLGRRRTSLVFDLLGWSIPTLLWAAAGGFSWFLAAAVVNASFRVVHTSWTCLLIEDSRPEQRVHVYAWIHVAGVLAGFFAPIAGILVARHSLVPTVRGLYLFAFVLMTSMFLLRNRFTRETAIGLVKMKESRNLRLGQSVAEHRRVLRELMASPQTLLAFFLLVLVHAQLVIKRTFFAILLARGLGFPEASIALFPAVESAVMLAVFILVMPAVGRLAPRRAMALGVLCSAAGYLGLLLTPGPLYGPALMATGLTACGTAVIFPTVQSLMANAIGDHDRAKVLAILNVFLLAATAPFGTIGGLLTAASPRLPFVLLTVLLGVSLALSARLAPATASPQ